MEEQLRKKCKEWGENTCITITAKYITYLQQLKWYDDDTRVMKQIHAYMRTWYIIKIFQISWRKDKIIKDLVFGRLAHYLE